MCSLAALCWEGGGRVEGCTGFCVVRPSMRDCGTMRGVCVVVIVSCEWSDVVRCRAVSHAVGGEWVCV